MISAEEYAVWQLDTTRDHARVVLVELDHAIGPAQSGHGRRDSRDTLNEVTSLLARTYQGTPGAIEVTWRQPTSQNGYHWEIWIDGELIDTTNVGDHYFTVTEGATAQVAIASAMPDGRYSLPWIVTIQAVNETQRIDGRLGSWSSVGAGAGNESTGTVRLSSRPYLDTAANVEYDDWLERGLQIETSLSKVPGVGDIDSYNPRPGNDADWLDYRWCGYPIRIDHGDAEWPRDRFRRIATTLNGGCRLQGASQYRFDAIDAGLRLRRTVLSADQTFTGTARETIDALVALAGIDPVVYTNTGTRTERAIRYEMRADTKLGDAVRLIVRSMGAELRVEASTGGFEVLIPDRIAPPSLIITEDDVTRRGVRMTDVAAAYATVLVSMGDVAETVRTFATGAYTGEMDEAISIATVLTSTADADAQGAEWSTHYARERRTYEISLHRVAGAIQEGDIVDVDHYLLSDAGLITRIIRQPFGGVTRVEVTV